MLSIDLRLQPSCFLPLNTYSVHFLCRKRLQATYSAVLRLPHAKRLSAKPLGSPQDADLSSLSDLDQKFIAWSDSGFSKGDCPTLTVTAASLNKARLLALQIPGKDRQYEIRRTRCISPLVTSVTCYGQQGLEELHGNELGSLTANVAFLGERLFYCNETDFLLESSCFEGSHKLEQRVIDCSRQLSTACMLQALPQRLDTIDLSQAINLLLRLAQADHWSPLLGRLVNQAAQRHYKMTSKQLPQLLWACARLNISPGPLLSPKCQRTLTQVTRSCTTSALITCLWSLAILRQVNSWLFVTAWQRLHQSHGIDVELTPYQAMQMHQVSVAMQYEGTVEELPELRFAESARQDKASSPKVSSYQRSLEDCLRSLGLSFQQEVDLSGLLVDVFIPSKNTVIELDGPTHFARNSPQLLGPTAFKHRMLRAMGFKLLSITLEDWDNLIDMRAQRAFLQAAMARRL